MFVRVSSEVSVPHIVLAVLFVIIFLVPASVHCAEEYVYYGVIDWDTSSALVSIVATKDGTEIQVYNLEDRNLISEVQLNSMETYFIGLSNGTVFKIISNNLIYVLLFSEGETPSPETLEGPVPAGFQTSTNGGYVGEEFIFMASQGLAGTYYQVLALEPSQVTVYREDGSTYTSFALQANEYKGLSLTAFKVYRVTSTGNIMIQSGVPGIQSFFIPSPKGGFVGKYIYSRSLGTWDVGRDYGFKISALEDSRVTVWNVESKRVIEQLEVSGGETATILPRGANEIMIESDEPIVCSWVFNRSLVTGSTTLHNFYAEASTSYVGVRPDEETPLLLPLESSVEAYIFACEDSIVQIDDMPMTIEADKYLSLTIPGLHKIRSNKNLVIQMIHWSLIRPEDRLFHGPKGFAAAIPCVQTISVMAEVSLTPLAGESFPITYALLGVVAALIIAAAGFILAKRHAQH